jgi:hypothetical protein
MAYSNIREEELKNKIAQDFFGFFDCTKIIGNIDFCVTLPTQDKHQQALFETESLFWAEAKRGKADVYKSLVQLILTIGKARTFDKSLPPAYLGTFDSEKIAFISYNEIHDIFYTNDFNWSVTPSNHETKEFAFVLEKVTQIIEKNSLLFNFDKDDKDIKMFIKANFIVGKSSTSKIKIDKNNFVVIYNKWLSIVKPTIAVDWDFVKKYNIIEVDFYFADILSQENKSFKDKLFAFLNKDHYELDRKVSESGLFSTSSVSFNDSQKAHTQFWNKYLRPPKKEYWEYIEVRRDLLVPQDVRERKGSFFTPQIWVELSQIYITNVLGEDWQDEYYIWDCAAGTGNLLNGLTNKYNIWASTLDKQDVDVMSERIVNGANLLDSHIFQFDFLNDDFSKLPKSLLDIINDPEKSRKLVIYINPPYAETGSTKQKMSKVGVSNATMSHKKFFDKMSTYSKRELYVQFLMRIYFEIPDCKIVNFSTLKNLQSSYFSEFREMFKAKLEKIFLVPANTFDNVKGKFPIGFFIWDCSKKEKFEEILADVFNEYGDDIGTKRIFSYNDDKYINDWLRPTWTNIKNEIGFLACNSNDFQNQQGIFIELNKKNKTSTYFKPISISNLIQSSIYFAVRHCIDATWLNDRDQFLYPNDGWKSNTEFQNDCLIYTLFNNDIQSKSGTNHWIPFTEYEVDSREKFDSNFMSDFISGKIEKEKTLELFKTEKDTKKTMLEFSEVATSVFDSGKALWKYYHIQPNCNVNASLYDIREYFQGRNEKGKMNNKSEDEAYMNLITDLRNKLKILAKKIEPKVYEYDFLKP